VSESPQSAAPSILSFSATFDGKDRTLVGRDGSFVDFVDGKGMLKAGVPLDSFPMGGGKVIFEWQVDGDALVDLVVHSDGVRVRDIPPDSMSKKTFTDLTDDGVGTYEWTMAGGHASLYADLRVYDPAKPCELACASTILGFTNAPVGGISLDVTQRESWVSCNWKVQGVGVAPAYLSVTTSAGKPIGSLITLRKRGDPRTEGYENINVDDYTGETIKFVAVVLGQPQSSVKNLAPFDLPDEGPVITSQKKLLKLAGVLAAIEVPTLPKTPDFKLPVFDPNNPLAFDYTVTAKQSYPFGRYGTLDLALNAGISVSLQPNPGVKVTAKSGWWVDAHKQISLQLESPLAGLLQDFDKAQIDAKSTLFNGFDAFSQKLKTDTDVGKGTTGTSLEAVALKQKIGEITLTTNKMKSMGVKPLTLALEAYAMKAAATADPSKPLKIKAAGLAGSLTSEMFTFKGMRSDLGSLQVKVTVSVKAELALFDLQQAAKSGSVDIMKNFGLAGVIVVVDLAINYVFITSFFSQFNGLDDFRDFDKKVKEASDAYNAAFKAGLNGVTAPECSGDIATTAGTGGTTAGRVAREKIHDAWAKDPPDGVKDAMGTADFETYWNAAQSLPAPVVKELSEKYTTQFKGEFVRQLTEQFIDKNVRSVFGDNRQEAGWAENLILTYYVGGERLSPTSDSGWIVITEKGANSIPPNIARWYLSLPIKKDSLSSGRFPIRGRDPY
jgi:hypothetical protein